MHQVVTVDRQQRPDRDHDAGHGNRVQPEDALEAADDQRDVHHVEADEHEHGRHQRQHHAPIAELGAGLDHLRQPHFRPLGTVEGHEQGAEHDAQRTGQGGPQGRQPEARPDETYGNGEEVEVAEEPERSLAAEPGVPFGLRDVVDRMAFDGQAATGFNGAGGCVGP
ncbi:hypothetical protein D9M68_586580 [compost metagenome]